MSHALTDGSLGTGRFVLLVVSLLIALGFEFVNGFHDTANAVATVIYTRSLDPRKAVVWSGFCNVCGVLLFGTGVAFSIVHLLPVDLLLNVGEGAGLAMVLALLLAAIAWNLGTWFLALPASSSHTLIGAILGVGLANSALEGHFGQGVNREAAVRVGLSLLISPAIGFGLSALLLVVLRRIVRNPELYQPPEGDRPPPRWIRAILLTTCTGVSVFHGSNDGQKGIGLVMLILIGILPAHYALDRDFGPAQAAAAVRSIDEVDRILSKHEAPAARVAMRHRWRSPGHRGPVDIEVGPAFRETLDVSTAFSVATARAGLAELRRDFEGLGRARDLPKPRRKQIRSRIITADAALARLEAMETLGLSEADRQAIDAGRARLRSATDYAPGWVKVAVALALGIGTMFGWKRIVVTVGEKIGKAHLTYAQGAAAELVAMTTIGLADALHLPVSTTHVLSSGVAGTMAASGSGVQARTIRNIALAWIFTLPASMLLAAGLFLVLRRVLGG